MRRLSLLGGLAAAAVAVALARRRTAARRERVDLYYEDGSMVSLEDRGRDAERLLALARDALELARARA